MERKKHSWLSSLVWAVVAFGLLFYKCMHGLHTTSGWIWGGLLFFLGILNLIIAATFLLGKAWVDPEENKNRLAKMHRTLWRKEHICRDATPEDFLPLNRGFYDQKTAEMQGQGFNVIRDIVNVTASSSWPRNHAVIRCFLEPAGTTVGSIFHARLYGLVKVILLLSDKGRRIETIEFESELNDGTYVTTSNCLETNRTLAPPFINRLLFTAKTSVEELATEHRSHLTRVLISKPGVEATVFTSNEDIAELQRRMHLLKCAFRNSPEFDYLAEFEKIKGAPLNTRESELAIELSDQLADESESSERVPRQEPP